jgi:RNA polymerase sigma-70 factor (ECF subfamily)
MDEQKILAERFEANRSHLRAVAYRMLGSRSEAEDAVQEAWLRLSRADVSEVDNFRGWLTTVAARVCLDMLRSRKSRREEALDPEGPEPTASGGEGSEPGSDMELADSVGLALLVVLETLAPAERVAFVLHDMFDLPFDEIAPIVGRSPAAARQLASRARRRVQGETPAGGADRARRQEIVDAFLAAARGGDFEGLLDVLDPDVVLRADHAAVAASLARMAAGAPALEPEIRGAEAVAATFRGRAQGATRALIDGVPGLAWAPGGQPRSVFSFAVADGKIVGIELVADPERIQKLDIVLIET